MLKQHNLFYKIIYFHIQYLQKYLHEILTISNIIGNDYLLLDFCQSLENLWSNYEVFAIKFGWNYKSDSQESFQACEKLTFELNDDFAQNNFRKTEQKKILAH